MWDGHSCPSPLTLVLIAWVFFREMGLFWLRGFRSRSKATDRSVRPTKAVRRVLCEKRMGTLTSHAENQNPNGLVESHLSQPTRKMGRLAFWRTRCGLVTHPVEMPDKQFEGRCRQQCKDEVKRPVAPAVRCQSPNEGLTNRLLH